MFVVKNIGFYLFVLLVTAVSLGAQPVGSKIHLDIRYQGESVKFKNTTKSGKTLKSENGIVVLADFSEQPCELNNLSFQQFPSKATTSYNQLYHLQLTVKGEREAMDIYLHQQIGLSYYLKIPFSPGRYFLTVQANEPSKQLEKITTDRYQKKIIEGSYYGLDISPKKWEAHKISAEVNPSEVVLADYQIASTKPTVSKIEFYRANSEQVQAVLKIENNYATYMYFEKSHDGIEGYFTTLYGEMIFQKDNAFYIKQDSSLRFEGSIKIRLVEGDEPNTEVLNGGLLSCNNGAFHELNALVFINSVNPDTAYSPEFFEVIKPDISTGERNFMPLPPVIKNANWFFRLNRKDRLIDAEIEFELNGMVSYSFYKNIRQIPPIFYYQNGNILNTRNQILLKKAAD